MRRSVSVVFFALALLSRFAHAQDNLIRVAIGTAPPDLTEQTFWFADANGFYKDEGIQVKLDAYNSDATAVRAVTAGEADIFSGGCAFTLRAIEAGAKMKVVFATAPKMDYLLVTQKGIDSASQLEGKNVGISGPGAVSYQVPRLMVTAAGGNPDKVHFVAVGGSAARTLALIGKKIDGGVLNSSFASRTLKYDYLHSIGNAAKDLPDFIYVCEVAPERLIQQKRKQLQAFVNGTLRGARWAMQHPDEAIKISQKLLPDTAKDEIVAGINAFAKSQYYSVDGLLRKEAWDFTVDELVKSGEIKKHLKYADYVDTGFSHAASKKLGPYKK